MIFHKTPIEDLYVIEPELREDERGYFTRVFCRDEFVKAGLDYKIVQMSHSFSRHKGTIRGLHFQTEPKSEDKIVSCVRGKIFDVAVDLRKNLPTYLKWFGIELSEENNKMLYIPKGFAHGLQTLVDNCTVQYFMSEFYSPEHASGIRWNDPVFGIKWPIKNPTMSDKDETWALMQDKK